MLDFPKFAHDHRLTFATAGHHHCHEGWIQTHCPRCTDGGHGYHLGFSLTRGTFNCWRCGPIRVVEAIRLLARVSIDKAWDLLRKYGGGTAERAAKQPVRQRQVPAPPCLGPLSPRHLKYIEKRGLPLSVVDDWELQGTQHLSGLWNWRVVFPVKNEQNVVVCYGGRSILKDAKPKYKMTENEKCPEDPKTFLYGIHKVLGDSVIIVEGPADVWNVGPGAVATLGIDWKNAQFNKLRKFHNRFIVFDPEEKAQKRAQQLADWLSLFPGETVIIEDLPSDPGSLPRRYVRRLRKKLLGREE